MKVVIVGGGVAGLTAALALRQAGHEVEVHEKYGHLQGRATGFTIWSYAAKQLGEIGLGEDKLAGIASPIDVTEIREQDGRLIGELPLGEVSRELGMPSYDLDRAGFQKLMVEELGDSVRMGSEVAGAEDGAVVLADGSRVEADVVVAADGIHSVLRDTVAGGAKLTYSGYAGWSALIEFEHDLLTVDHHVELWGHDAKAGVASAGPGHARWYVAGREPAGKQLGKDAALARVDGWYELIGAAIEATDESEIVYFEAWDLGPLASWVSGRTVLVGDAAHATTPFAAMGACMAITDGVELARLLTSAGSVEEALASFQEERKGRTEKIVRGARGKRHLMMLHNPVAVWLRREMFTHMPADRWSEIARDMASGGD